MSGTGQGRADGGYGAGNGNGEAGGDNGLKPFGAQVRLLRERAGLTQAEFGRRIGYSEELVRSVENGRRFPQPDFVEAAERVLDADGVLAVAQKHLARARVRYPPWFRDFAKLEAEAASLYIYENHVVPGLLQTEDYARAIFRSSRPPLDEEEIERRIAARLDRQELLTRTPPVMLSVVLEQVALERPLGGAEVMRQQLGHLLECTHLRNLELQIMPTRRDHHAGLNGPMQLVETEEQQRLVYCEVQRGSTVISEPRDVSVLNQRYGILRTQALTPEDSASLLERLRGEL